MTRLAMLIVAALALGACNKPSTENCRKALANMQRLLGTDNLHDDAAMEGEVRRCKGGSTRKSVECAIGAQTLDDLKKCNFYKGPLPSGPAVGSGSAGTGAGSAASGSGAGSAPGSATEPPGGSGAGAGSATAPGSATGSG